MNVYEVQMERCWKRKPEVLGKNPSSLNFVHNKNPRGIVWNLRGVSEVRGRSLNFSSNLDIPVISVED
jgi:hypothetical protein